jgi:predicted GIY-YIG superfamily endonuclease
MVLSLPMDIWYLYILECCDKSLYTGVTLNLQRRIKAHDNGSGGSYTHSKLPVSLVYFESYSTKSEALKRELQIKGWARKKKLALIRQELETLKKLSKSSNKQFNETILKRTNGRLYYLLKSRLHNLNSS